MLDRFELTQLVAQGPRGETWVGLDHHDYGNPERQQKVVIKLLDPARCGEAWLERQNQLAQLFHNQLAPVLFADQAEDGRCYMVRAWLGSPALPLWYAQQEPKGRHIKVLLQLLIRLCEGLEAAHRAGIPHLGLKPGNILIRDTAQGPLPVLCDLWMPPREQAALYLAPEQLGLEL